MSSPPRDGRRVVLLATGAGVVPRGIETFFSDCLANLRGRSSFELSLCKGAGDEQADEHVLWNVPRDGTVARVLGRVVRRSSYAVEQLSALLPLLVYLRRTDPRLIFYSDSNLGFQLYRLRRPLGLRYRLLFSNGGPCRPPFGRTDFVQQLTPYHLEEAIHAGEPASRHFLVPYGAAVPDRPPTADERRQARLDLGLPLDRRIVLTVGWVARQHKRMDHVVRELALLPVNERPHLVILGHQDAASPPVIDLARELLGDGCALRSVSFKQVAAYYRAADLFTLASLREGFGRVYVEAMSFGLPSIVHDHPVMRFIHGAEGCYIDMVKPGALASAIQEVLRSCGDAEGASRRHAFVQRRFSWAALAPDYDRMFSRAMDGS